MKIIHQQSIIYTLQFAILFFFISCTKRKEVPDIYGFPDEVGAVFLKKCATSGCHTDASKSGAGGLNLSSWDKMFEGSSNGEPVIPYNTDYSSLLSFINTFPDLGSVLQPTMPVNGQPLTREDVVLIKNWISNGAPNRYGFVKFSDNPNRKKFYVCNRGCDVVTVFDAETHLPMRFINVGVEEISELPVMIRVSPDGNYWYVIFSNGEYMQKYRTSDDVFVGQVKLDLYDWCSMSISSDSKTAVCVDQSPQGRIAVIDLETMSVVQMYGGNATFVSPHGVSFFSDSVFYTCASTGNFIYRVNMGSPYSALKPNVKKISFESGAGAQSSSSFTPFDIQFSASKQNYYITCQKSNEVRVMDAVNDSLLKIISTPASPAELCLPEGSGYMFVSCTNDITSFAGKPPGSVLVIDQSSFTEVKKIYTGCEPQGLAADQQVIYVANRNVSSQGPAPHHTSGTCAGRNGYITIIDVQTLNLIPGKKMEVAVNPYSISAR